MADVDQLLTMEDISAKLQTTPSNIYRKIKAGKFPPPIRLSTRCVRWRQSQITAWMDGLATDAPGSAAPQPA